MRAVRFHTKKNKMICSDPDDNWAEKAMAVVDRRRTLTMEPSKEPTATTTTIQWPTTNAGYTRKDNRCDFGPISPLPTIPGDGRPESCCNNMTSTTIPVKSILKYHIRSRSKKGLHKFQAAVWQRKQKNSVDFV